MGLSFEFVIKGMDFEVFNVGWVLDACMRSNLTSGANSITIIFRIDHI